MKTGVLVAVLVVAWRTGSGSRALGLGAELALLAGLIVAVAVLTDLRPPPRAAAAGQSRRARRARAAARRRGRARGEDDDVAVGLAASPARQEHRRARHRPRPGRQGHRRAAVRIGRRRRRPVPGRLLPQRRSRSPRRGRVAVAARRQGREARDLRFRLPAAGPRPPRPRSSHASTDVFRALARSSSTSTSRRAPGTRSTPSTACGAGQARLLDPQRARRRS